MRFQNKQNLLSKEYLVNLVKILSKPISDLENQKMLSDLVSKESGFESETTNQASKD